MKKELELLLFSFGTGAFLFGVIILMCSLLAQSFDIMNYAVYGFMFGGCCYIPGFILMWKWK